MTPYIRRESASQIVISAVDFAICGRKPKKNKQSKKLMSDLEAIAEKLQNVDWPDTPAKKIEAQSLDKDLAWVIRQKKSGPNRPAWEEFSGSGEIRRYLVTNWDRLHLQNDILYHELINATGDRLFQFVVPKHLQQVALQQMHSDLTAGHFAFDKTKERILRRMWWPVLSKSINKFLEKCDECALRNTPRNTPRAPARKCYMGLPGERLDIDLVGPLLPSSKGNLWILTVVDTKWSEFYALPNATAETVVSALVQNYFTRFGVYNEVFSDQGRNLDGEKMREVGRLLGFYKVRTVA